MNERQSCDSNRNTTNAGCMRTNFCGLGGGGRFDRQRALVNRNFPGTSPEFPELPGIFQNPGVCQNFKAQPFPKSSSGTCPQYPELVWNFWSFPGTFPEVSQTFPATFPEPFRDFPGNASRPFRVSSLLLQGRD